MRASVSSPPKWEVGLRARPVQAFLVLHADPELRSHPSPRLTRQSFSHRAGSPRTATAPTPGPPPHPQRPAAVGSGAVGGITSAGSRTLSTMRGRLVPGEARSSLSPASVYRKCAAPPSLLLQYHWPTSGDRGRLQIPTNPILGLLIPSMQRRP